MCPRRGRRVLRVYAWGALDRTSSHGVDCQVALCIHIVYCVVLCSSILLDLYASAYVRVLAVWAGYDSEQSGEKANRWNNSMPVILILITQAYNKTSSNPAKCYTKRHFHGTVYRKEETEGEIRKRTGLATRQDLKCDECAINSY